MSKYIIKNCSVCEFSDWEECTGYMAEGYICNDIHTEIIECKDRTDCVMKQIVELCNKIIFLNGGTDFTDVDMYKHAVGENFVAKQVLQLLQIEEVE